MKSPDLTSAKTSVRAGNGIGAGLLKRAVLRVESNWGAIGEFYLNECWLSQ